MTVVELEQADDGGWIVLLLGRQIGPVHDDRDDAEARARDLAERRSASLRLRTPDGGEVRTDKHCLSFGE